MTASDIIELVGGEVSWEILNADGTWYVIASHHGLTDDESFKFEYGDEYLKVATRRCANDVLAWQKRHKWPA